MYVSQKYFIVIYGIQYVRDVFFLFRKLFLRVGDSQIALKRKYLKDKENKEALVKTSV